MSMTDEEKTIVFRGVRDLVSRIRASCKTDPDYISACYTRDSIHAALRIESCPNCKGTEFTSFDRGERCTSCTGGWVAKIAEA
jgi:hypothetical protein